MMFHKELPEVKIVKKEYTQLPTLDVLRQNAKKDDQFDASKKSSFSQFLKKIFNRKTERVNMKRAETLEVIDEPKSYLDKVETGRRLSDELSSYLELSEDSDFKGFVAIQDRIGSFRAIRFPVEKIDEIMRFKEGIYKLVVKDINLPEASYGNILVEGKSPSERMMTIWVPKENFSVAEGMVRLTDGKPVPKRKYSDSEKTTGDSLSKTVHFLDDLPTTPTSNRDSYFNVSETTTFVDTPASSASNTVSAYGQLPSELSSLSQRSGKPPMDNDQSITDKTFFTPPKLLNRRALALKRLNTGESLASTASSRQFLSSPYDVSNSTTLVNTPISERTLEALESYYNQITDVNTKFINEAKNEHLKYLSPLLMKDNPSGEIQDEFTPGDNAAEHKYQHDTRTEYEIKLERRRERKRDEAKKHWFAKRFYKKWKEKRVKVKELKREGKKLRDHKFKEYQKVYRAEELASARERLATAEYDPGEKELGMIKYKALERADERARIQADEETRKWHKDANWSQVRLAYVGYTAGIVLGAATLAVTIVGLHS